MPPIHINKTEELFNKIKTEIMNSNSYSRSWNGVGDDVHPLSRTGHSAVAHGRYIYVLNGYGPSDDKMVLFEQMGITRYDILTNRIECLPVHWDLKSLQNHMFNEFILLTSGNSAVLCPELLDKNNKKQSACIYTFGGYSLLACTQQDISKHQCIHLTMLKSFQRRLNDYQSVNIELKKNCINCLPSPRDKFCMEYWHGKLYIFGGYGPQFNPSTTTTWPNQFYHWPYLYDPNDHQSWIICDHNAHCSIILPNHGWLIIFGGRGPYNNNNTTNSYHMGRLNDMYCLNLYLMEWTKILTPLDIPQIKKQPSSPLSSSTIWPCGRSWMNMLLLWITPSQIHNPVNYSRNGIDHLTQYIQQTIMSTLIWYQNRSTFFIDIVHAPNILNTLNELFPSRSSLSSITMQTLNKPIHRHWHTITLGLNGLVYVIGGASQEALEKPLECYNLHRPISLIKQCSIKITKLILSRLLYEIECDYLKGREYKQKKKKWLLCTQM
ncbi:hypothetical protein Smp_143360 [Schistosoma mansoni]|uniref:hypothetical protein n=1 Tax=Schistosoma mansoni TaxID=6183 RepID=UPI0001A6406C|nr:hypothetical protein Smp_143360 [Schistosoma mansoni]|eukprot:XP_018645719.1 hypothetical protein Smp_143360 [Schistosoma mansoni]